METPISGLGLKPVIIFLVGYELTQYRSRQILGCVINLTVYNGDYTMDKEIDSNVFVLSFLVIFLFPLQFMTLFL